MKPRPVLVIVLIVVLAVIAVFLIAGVFIGSGWFFLKATPKPLVHEVESQPVTERGPARQLPSDVVSPTPPSTPAPVATPAPAN